MSTMRIFRDTDPELRQKCEPVEVFDADLFGLIRDMIDTMYMANGVGLAAPQVGVGKRVIVVDPDGKRGSLNLIAMVNPVITKKADMQSSREGCLSVKQKFWNQPVPRAKRITVIYQSPNGSVQKEKFHGHLAAIIQHEVDHLDGILFTDYLKTPVDKAKEPEVSLL